MSNASPPKLLDPTVGLISTLLLPHVYLLVKSYDLFSLFTNEFNHLKSNEYYACENKVPRLRQRDLSDKEGCNRNVYTCFLSTLLLNGVKAQDHVFSSLGLIAS